jgi:hypothetical protein
MTSNKRRVHKIKARDIIFHSEQLLDGALFRKLHDRMIEQNSVLAESITVRMGEKYQAANSCGDCFNILLARVKKGRPMNERICRRHINMVIIGLSLLGASDRDEEDGRYVRVSAESIAWAEKNSEGYRFFIRRTNVVDEELGALYQEALEYVYSFNELLNESFGVVDSIDLLDEAAIYFNAYLEEYIKQKLRGS